MLTVRGLAAWAGTAHLPRLIVPAASAAPAAAIFDLFVAGRAVARSRLPELGELVEREGEMVTARANVLPLGSGFVVCDRATWPDDSSYHLAACLPPGPIGRWIDLGCGSAFAAIARPRLGREVGGIELVPATARFAVLGAALSQREIEITVGDIALDHPWRGTCDLVSCNMPIPDGGTEPWRSTDAALFDRLWPAARALLAPGGMVVVHSALAPLAGLALPGEVVTVAYTPDPMGFGVTWWRPDGPPEHRRGARLLDLARPHLDWSDREA